MRKLIPILLASLLVATGLQADSRFSVGKFEVEKESERRGESSVLLKLAKIKMHGQKGKVIQVDLTLEQGGKKLTFDSPSRGKTYSNTHTLWHFSGYFRRSDIVAAGMDLNRSMQACVIGSAGGSVVGSKCISFTPGGRVTKPAEDKRPTPTEPAGETKESAVEQARGLDAGGRYGRLFLFTDEAISKGDRDPRLMYLRGYAKLKLGNCEAALADLARASSLGFRDESMTGSDLAGRTREANECKRRLPLRATYPSGSADYQVGVRYSRAGVYGDAARRMLPQVGRTIRKMFGVEPKMVMAFVFQNEEEASDFRSATGLDVTPMLMRPEATGFGGDFLVLFNARKVPTNIKDPDETIVHELIHVMDRRTRPEGKTRVPDWWIEGIATYGTALHFGKVEELSASWARSYKQAGGIYKDRVLGGTGSFQGEPRYVPVNYLTSALMVKELVDEYGLDLIRRMTLAQTRYAHFRKEFNKLTRSNEHTIYDRAVARVQKASGLNFEDQQYVTPQRSSFRSGDLILARNTYNRSQVEYLPAMFSGWRGGRAAVYYHYGSSSVVPRDQVVHFNWRSGVRVRCRINDNYRTVTVRIATRKEVVYEGGRVALGSCNELGDGPKNR